MKRVVPILAVAIAIACTFSSEAKSQVRFGSTLSLSGSTASYGDNARDGMELAREEINSNRGVRGEKLEIVYEDIGEIDLKRAASAAHKFISIDKVSAILPMVTEDAEVVHPIAESSGVITMAVFAGGKDLTRGKRLLYQVSSADEALMRRLADHVASLKIKKVCILAEEGAYALPLANYAKEYLSVDKQISVTISDYPPDTTDFRTQIAKLRSLNCPSLLLITPPSRQGVILNHMARIKWSPLKLGLEASEDPQVLQAARKGSEGIVYARYMTSTEDFARKFTERFKREPGLPAALAYDAVKVMAYAMNQSVNASTDELARTLGRIRSFSGASGTIEFEDGTRVERPVELWTIENGVPVRLNVGCF